MALLLIILKGEGLQVVPPDWKIRMKPYRVCVCVKHVIAPE